MSDGLKLTIKSLIIICIIYTITWFGIEYFAAKKIEELLLKEVQLDIGQGSNVTLRNDGVSYTGFPFNFGIKITNLNIEKRPNSNLNSEVTTLISFKGDLVAKVNLLLNSIKISFPNYVEENTGVKSLTAESKGSLFNVDVYYNKPGILFKVKEPSDLVNIFKTNGKMICLYSYDPVFSTMKENDKILMESASESFVLKYSLNDNDPNSKNFKLDIAQKSVTKPYFLIDEFLKPSEDQYIKYFSDKVKANGLALASDVSAEFGIIEDGREKNIIQFKNLSLYVNDLFLVSFKGDLKTEYLPTDTMQAFKALESLAVKGNLEVNNVNIIAYLTSKLMGSDFASVANSMLEAANNVTDTKINEQDVKNATYDINISKESMSIGKMKIR